jgi:hypothetical protein
MFDQTGVRTNELYVRVGLRPRRNQEDKLKASKMCWEFNKDESD